jgi:hypothetical protein
LQWTTFSDAEVEGMEYLYSHAQPGSAVVLAAQNAPTRLAANYEEFNLPPSARDPDLLTEGQLQHTNLAGPRALKSINEFMATRNGAAKYLIITDSMDKYANYYGYLPSGSFAALDKALGRTAGWSVFYRNRSMVIYRFTSDRPDTGRPTPG